MTYVWLLFLQKWLKLFKLFGATNEKKQNMFQQINNNNKSSITEWTAARSLKVQCGINNLHVDLHL